MTIYTIILIIMVILATTGLFIGVMNDAANFLNSAIGSKAASVKVIMAVASFGIIFGAVTSSGMMEVARNGVFNPALFTFHDVMMLYLAVMLANIILLDVYNTLGLPTSTTVALVFCLLGSALAISVYKIGHSPELTINSLGQFINSSRAMAIVAAILLSVILAFTCGAIVMYISRLIFTFRYQKIFRRFGALWCGLSFTAIVYFALLKGLKNVLGSFWVIQFIEENLGISLLIIWVVCTIVLLLLQLVGINILKTTILAGTFSLALSFAGNDLVNFIGVPVAGFDSYKMAVESGDIQMTMEGLNGDVSANMLLLLSAGVIMIITLWTSKRALSVSKTELSLSSQNSEGERYGSSLFSRSIVRAALNINNWYERYTPAKIRQAVSRRFEQLPEEERSGASYDLIRATVNLTTASILICMATSLKLPLSTTYVCFMVSMGSSLADKAWGRESAVYRITGVMTVVAGWFVTGFGALIIAFTVAISLMYGGNVAIIVISLLCGYMLLQSNIKKNRQVKAESNKPAIKEVSDSNIVRSCVEEVCEVMEKVTRIYDRTLLAVFKENRKVLREMVRESNDLFYQSRERKYAVLPTIQKLQDSDMDTSHYYVQVVDYMSEVTKALVHITRPCFDHIDNNHEGFTKEQVEDLMKINDKVENIYSRINNMLQSNDFSEIDLVLEMRDRLFESIAEAIKSQIKRIKNRESSTKASMLYLTILNETKTMVLQSRNLLKSQRYFLEHSNREI